MTTPVSGQISLQDLANEFGGSAPHAINEYYRNGGLVPNSASSVATSGQVHLNSFYNTTNEDVLAYTGTSNTVTLNLVGTADNVTSAAYDVSGDSVIKSIRAKSNFNANGSTNIQVDLVGETVTGAYALTRGSITESGPTTLSHASSSGDAYYFFTKDPVHDIVVPSNKFLVGIKIHNNWTSGPRHSDNIRKIHMGVYIRYASLGTSTWTGSNTNTSMVTSETNNFSYSFGGVGRSVSNGVNPSSSGYGNYATLGTNNIANGIRISNGGAGEWTDNANTNFFEIGLIGRPGLG
jgi:hypothetical protein